jgi:hypothetical protein
MKWSDSLRKLETIFTQFSMYTVMKEGTVTDE